VILSSPLGHGPDITALMAYQMSGGESVWRQTWFVTMEYGTSYTVGGIKRQDRSRGRTTPVMHLLRPAHYFASYLVEEGEERWEGTLANRLELMPPDHVVCMECLASVMPYTAWIRRDESS